MFVMFSWRECNESKFCIIENKRSKKEKALKKLPEDYNMTPIPSQREALDWIRDLTKQGFAFVCF